MPLTARVIPISEAAQIIPSKMFFAQRSRVVSSQHCGPVRLQQSLRFVICAPPRNCGMG